MRSGAYFSCDRKFRYWLIRAWDDNLPLLCTIGANPSVANETANDHTITKEMEFSRRFGFGGLLKLNLGAYCSTDPAKWRSAFDPWGPENSVDHLAGYITQFNPAKSVACWGKCGGKLAAERGARLTKTIPDLWCFGRNSDGTPRHTLMLPYSTPLEPYARV